MLRCHHCAPLRYSAASHRHSRIPRQHSRIPRQHSRIPRQHSRIPRQHSRIPRCHPREGGDPGVYIFELDSRLRGNDNKKRYYFIEKPRKPHEQ